jgi:hypothetical protein
VAAAATIAGQNGHRYAVLAILPLLRGGPPLDGITLARHGQVTEMATHGSLDRDTDITRAETVSG